MTHLRAVTGYRPCIESTKNRNAFPNREDDEWRANWALGVGRGYSVDAGRRGRRCGQLKDLNGAYVEDGNALP